MRENSGPKKTGGLWGAYNYELEHATSRYSYVSFIQGDMQVMRWGSSTNELIDKVFSTKRDNVFMVSAADGDESTGTGVLGWHEPTSDHRRKPSTIDATRGAAGVGIYSMEVVAREGFIFEEDEAFVSNKMVSRGYVIARLSESRITYVGWPGTVRSGVPKGNEPPTLARAPFVKLIQLSEASRSSIPGIGEQQQMVVPNGFRMFYPYWLTDIEGPKWIFRRKQVVTQPGIPFFSEIAEFGNLSSFFCPGLGKRHPKISYVLRRLVFGAVRELRDRVSLRIFLLVRKFARAPH